VKDFSLRLYFGQSFVITQTAYGAGADPFPAMDFAAAKNKIASFASAGSDAQYKAVAGWTGTTSMFYSLSSNTLSWNCNYSITFQA
jgi:hypothetical protein